MTELPRWVFFWNAIAILCYQTLDNMDGKQAQRTKSSSPLGLLFDHGIDAINNIFGSGNWIICFMLDPRKDSWQCFICIFLPYTVFFMSTWEEYHTGELIMPIINGPNEGLLMGIVANVVSWWYGPGIWQQSTIWDNIVVPAVGSMTPLRLFEWLPTSMSDSEIILLLVSILFVPELISKIFFVAKSYPTKSPISKLIPFVTLFVCSFVVGYVDLDIWLSMPRTSLHLCAALYVEMTTALMIAHVTETSFEVKKRWILLPLVMFSLGVCLGWIKHGVATENFLLIYASSAMTYLAVKFAVIVDEMCKVLNIWCFDIITPRRSLVDRRIENGHLKKES